MTTTLIADRPVEVDAEGFLTHTDDWGEELAAAIARDSGIAELTPRHWLVVNFMRDRYLATGTAPSIRALGKESGVPSRSSTSSSPRDRPSSQPRSAASPSHAAASRKEHTMTELLEQPLSIQTEPTTIEKVSIVISKGSLEGIYPGLIMANGARMEGIDADVFFTFFGLDTIRKDRDERSRSHCRQPRHAPTDPCSAPCPASPRSPRR
jgi:TusE/DsrC/DsvC family sulfur relay protein